MIHNNIEDTDGYRGLYGEVVTSDVYDLRLVDFEPDVVFDLGANIGVFARFARELFPKARIICVEPGDENFAHLQKFAPADATLIKAAIGVGEVWESLDIPNGSHGCFMSPGAGYPRDELATAANVRRSEVPLLMPDELIRKYASPTDKVVLKMDIEGNEHTVFSHEPSMLAIRKLDYLAFEIHRHAQSPKLYDYVQKTYEDVLASFADTHTCSRHQCNFLARKRGGTLRDWLGHVGNRSDMWVALARRQPNASIVEIGCAYGAMSAEILQICSQSHALLVDPFESQPANVWPDTCNMPQSGMNAMYEKFLASIEPYKERATVARSYSHQVATGLPATTKFDVVYIDGNHSYNAVRQDIESWWPRIKSGGILAGHDYTENPDKNVVGVIPAVNEFVAANGLTLYRLTRNEDCSWALRKP